MPIRELIQSALTWGSCRKGTSDSRQEMSCCDLWNGKLKVEISGLLVESATEEICL